MLFWKYFKCAEIRGLEHKRSRNMQKEEVVREHRRRVGEAVKLIEKAVAANRRVYEIECQADELMPPGTAHGGLELHSACYPLLNEECFDDWIHYLQSIKILDDCEL
jgi:hypothetical protein